MLPVAAIRALVGVGSAALLLIGCSPSSDGLANKLNACVIVTEADVELAIGTPVTPGVQQNDRQCLYQAKRNADETVIVELQADHTKAGAAFHDQRSKAGRQPVPDIGDGAFTLRSPIGGIQLTFLKQDALVTLSLSSPTQANPQAAVTNLAKVAAAKLAVPRLPVAGAPAPSRPATVSAQWAGDWYGCVPVGLLFGKGHLTLADDGAWTLTTAILMPGTLTAARGQWQADSYPEILHGTYHVAETDRFSTTGMLNVSWNKLDKNQAPRKFDSSLWQAFKPMPRKVAVKRLPPVDPPLLGTWEGSVKFVDRQEDFVWTITAANQSEFYKATSQTGRIVAEAGGLRLTFPQSTKPALTLQVAPDKLDLIDAAGVRSQWGRSEKQLSRC